MMKKIVLGLILLFSVQMKAHAFQTALWLSSNTATATASTQTLCGTAYMVGTSSYSLRGILHGVCVNTAAAGSVQVFGSTYSYVSQMSITGSYSTGTQIPCNYYDAISINGLSYNKNGAADVTILYQCY